MRRVDAHFNGKGIKDGIHGNATSAVLSNLGVKQFRQKCALESFIAAATWPAEQVHGINSGFASIGLKCGSEAESALHCFWECFANNNIGM